MQTSLAKKHDRKKMALTVLFTVICVIYVMPILIVLMNSFKSNAAVNAIFAAMNSVKRTKTTVPVHLQDAHYGGHEKLGHGIGYKYAHDYPNHYVQQQYLPDEIKDEKFYELSDMGYEKKLKEHMEFIRRNKQ